MNTKNCLIIRLCYDVFSGSALGIDAAIIAASMPNALPCNASQNCDITSCVVVVISLQLSYFCSTCSVLVVKKELGVKMLQITKYMDTGQKI